MSILGKTAPDQQFAPPLKVVQRHCSQQLVWPGPWNKNYGSTEPPQQKCGSRNFATLTKEGLYEFMKGTVLGTFGNILLKLYEVKHSKTI